MTAKEKAVTERIDKEREATKERLAQHPMSRTSSRTGSDRHGPRTPTSTGATSVPPSPRVSSAVAASVRSTFSFAAAASARKAENSEDDPEPEPKVNSITEQLGEVVI